MNNRQKLLAAIPVFASGLLAYPANAQGAEDSPVAAIVNVTHAELSAAPPAGSDVFSFALP